MRPGGSREKGNTFERWVANGLNAALGLAGDKAARRGLSQTRGGGAEVSDVTLPGWALHFECKHSKADTPRTAIRQATADLAARGDTTSVPVAVVRKHGQRIPVVGMYAADATAFLALGVPGGRSPHGVDLRASARRLVRETSLADFDDDHPLVLFSWPDFLALLARIGP